jgi:glycosyltransferase involved in cell wall biosynthesis
MIRAKRKVLHFHTPDFSDRPAYRRAVERAQSVIFCSAALRARFVATVGEIPRPLVVIQNGVDLDRFKDTREDGLRFRANLGIGPDEFVVLFAGQLTQVKGPHILVEAIKHVRHQVDRPVKLVIVGNSTLWQKAGKTPLESPYERQLISNADPDLVTFAGALPQGEMPAAYAACDLFALPSVWFEPSPVTIREAMATGRPVIGSRVGGIPELVRDGESGLLVSPGNARELANAITRLALDDAMRLRMGSASASLAHQFDWQLVADEVFASYARVWSNE